MADTIKKNFTQINKQLFINILIELFKVYSTPGKEKNMQDYLNNFFETEVTNFSKINDAKGNILLSRKSPGDEKVILLNAHMDAWMDPVTDNYLANLNYYEKQDAIISPGFGIGCDDKVGIGMILYLAKYTNKSMKILFTVEEEIGSHGVHAVDTQFYDDVNFCLTLDRKAYNDIIQVYGGKTMATDYQIGNLIAVGKETGLTLEVAIGSMADTMTISYSVPAVNLSVGYYRAHDRNDHVIVTEAINILKAVDAMVDNSDYLANNQDDSLLSKKNDKFFSIYNKEYRSFF